MKTENLTLLIIAIVVWIGYNLPIALKYGIQSSVSAQYNLFKTSWGKSLMSWFIVGIAIPMMIVADHFIGVWAGIFLSLIFAAPSVRISKTAEVLHVLGANMGLILGMASLLYINIWWWPVVLTYAIYTLVSMKIGYKHHTYWIETIGFIVIMVGLFIEKVVKLN